VLELTVEEAAAYRLRAMADLPATGEVSDQDLFLALRASRELRDIQPRPDLLAAISAAALDGSEHGDELDPSGLAFNEARTVQVNRRKIMDVWNAPWVLGLFALFLGTEWSLRRRWGRL